MSGVNADAEQAIAELRRSGQLELAATRALEAYGGEILSFLIARLRSESDGDEAFSMFAEDLWKALPSFEFRCSLRTYAYTLARNAANRHAATPHNRRDRNAALPSNPSLLIVVEGVRTATQAYRRTDVKDRMRTLRESLSPDDQTLLMLHVDRNLPWREIALVMHDGAQPLSDDDAERESARLRKRFERVKGELKVLAQKAGLIER